MMSHVSADISLNTRKRLAAKVLYRASSGLESPEGKLFFSIIAQAVRDIGTIHESRKCWADKSLEPYMEYIGLNPNYAKQVISDAGLIYPRDNCQ